MKPRDLRVTGLLNDAQELASAVAAPWMGVLWLTALPLRLLQVHFADTLLQLGSEAEHYGRYLGELSLAVGLAWLLSLYGRAVYAGACHRRMSSGRSPGWAALRVAPGKLLNYVHVSLWIELLLLTLAYTVVMIPLCILLAGLAAASCDAMARPRLVQPFSTVIRFGNRPMLLLGLLAIFGIAWVVAAVNLLALFQLLLWLSGGFAGLETGPWTVLLSPFHRRFLLLLMAGATLIVEPFWLATNVVFVRRHQARKSGEDLRGWLAELRLQGALP